MIRIALYILILNLVFLPHSFCQEEGQELGQLEQINLKVEQESQNLQATIEKEKNMQASMNTILAAIKKIQGEDAVLKKALEKKRLEGKGLESEVAEASNAIEKINKESLKRLRVLYMHRRENLLEKVMLISSESTVSRNAIFLSRIKEADNKLIESFYHLKKAKLESIKSLAAIIKEQESLKVKIEARRSELKGKQDEQLKLFAALKSERANIQEGIANLRAQALRIETVVISLTGEDKKEPATADKSRGKNEGSTRGTAGDFEGAGLAEAKGKINYPVDGDIFSWTKDAKSADFKNILNLKGVHFTAVSGARVGAVSDGKVIYVGKMPVIGNIVIIDHGKRFYSLYGRLSEILVQKGDLVKEFKKIASAEEAKPDQPNFYFEIRKNGKPENTRGYLIKN